MVGVRQEIGVEPQGLFLQGPHHTSALRAIRLVLQGSLGGSSETPATKAFTPECQLLPPQTGPPPPQHLFHKREVASLHRFAPKNRPTGACSLRQRPVFSNGQEPTSCIHFTENCIGLAPVRDSLRVFFQRQANHPTSTARNPADACPQVDASILVAWVGNLAAKISLAASNCALTLNVDSVCAAGGPRRVRAGWWSGGFPAQLGLVKRAEQGR